MKDRDPVLKATEAQSDKIFSKVPFELYVIPHSADFKVQFSNRKLDLTVESNWVDYPNGNFSNTRELVHVCGGDNIVFRLVTTNMEDVGGVMTLTNPGSVGYMSVSKDADTR